MSPEPVTSAESIEPAVRARLERDIADNNPPMKLDVEDVFDFEPVLEGITEHVAAAWSALGWDALDVDGIDDDDWIEMTSASRWCIRPWVFCTVGCTPDIYGGYEPCSEHRDLYEGTHGISFEDARADAAERRAYMAGGEF